MVAIQNNYAGIWDLKTPQEIFVPKTESFFPLGSGGVESILGHDGRTLVDPADYADGGKYRGKSLLFFFPSHTICYILSSTWLINQASSN